MKLDELTQYGIDADEIKYHLNKYHRAECAIAVTGEFNAGKSRLINCMLGKQDFLPYGKTECTSVLVDMSEGEEEKLGLLYLDGREESADYSRGNIEQYVRFDYEREQKLLSVAIPVAGMSLGKGVHIIDTPGTNTVQKEHETATRYILKKADLVLYVFNRTLGRSDLEHISEIRKYTCDILFVMTHIDEVDDEKGVEHLILEAKSQISGEFGCEKEEIVVFPVDCIRGIEHREYVDALLECVRDYLSTRSEERNRRNARKRITAIILEGIDSLQRKEEFLAASKEKTEHETRDKVRKYEEKRRQAEEGHDRVLAKLDDLIGSERENCLTELNHLLVESREKIGAEMEKNSSDREDLMKRMDDMNCQTSMEIRRYVEQSVGRILNAVYAGAQTELKKLAEDFEIQTPLQFDVPEIEELKYSRLAEELEDVNRQIEENLAVLRKLESDSDPDKAEEIRRQIGDLEAQYDKSSNCLLQLGAYRPKYDYVTQEGGKENGKAAGRILGEIADIGLLLWNPAGAAGIAAEAAKAVDKTKDAATIIRYLKNTLPMLKKADAVRREVRDTVKYAEPQGEESGFSKMLDYLSIGYWAEKAGGYIGEQLNPSRMIAVENEEMKLQYEKSRKDLIQECSKLSAQLFQLKDQLKDINDYGKEKRIRRDIEETRKALEEKKRWLEGEKQREAAENRNTREKAYYAAELQQYFQALKSDGENLVKNIYEGARLEIAGRLAENYGQKMNELDGLMGTMAQDGEGIDKEIQKYHRQISELSGYEDFVEGWLAK